MTSILGSLQKDPLVAYPAGDALSVEVLQKRDGVFAADASQVLEVRNVNLGRLGLVCCELTAQLFQRAAVENKFVGNFDQHFIPQEQSNNLLRADFIDFQPANYLIERRYLQACQGKGLLDRLFGLGLFVPHDHAAPSKVNEFAGGLDFSLLGKSLQNTEKDISADVESFAKFLFADSRNEWIGVVESGNRGKYFGLGLAEGCWGEQSVMALDEFAALCEA